MKKNTKLDGMDVRVEKGIDIPKSGRGRPAKYNEIVSSMENPGDSIFVNTVIARQGIATNMRRRNIPYVTRRAKKKSVNGFRIWRVK